MAVPLSGSPGTSGLLIVTQMCLQITMVSGLWVLALLQRGLLRRWVTSKPVLTFFFFFLSCFLAGQKLCSTFPSIHHKSTGRACSARYPKVWSVEQNQFADFGAGKRFTKGGLIPQPETRMQRDIVLTFQLNSCVGTERDRQCCP